MKHLMIFLMMGLMAFTTFSCKKDKDEVACIDTSITEGVATRHNDPTDEISVLLEDDCIFPTPDDLPANTVVEPFLIGEMWHWYTTDNPLFIPDQKRKQEGQIWAQEITVRPHQLSITGKVNWTKKSTYIANKLTGIGSGDGWKSVKLIFSDTSSVIRWDGVPFKLN